MIDRTRLKEDAQHVRDSYGTDTMAGMVAARLLQILEEPSLVLPEGYAVVRRPELLGKGVAAR